jgi:hypothetical protein
MEMISITIQHKISCPLASNAITFNHHQMEAMAFGHYQMVEITFGLQLPFNDQNFFPSPSTYKNDFGFH